MPATKTKTKTKAKTQTEKPRTEDLIEFPNVQPSSRMARNLPHPPTTLRVCGNTIPVRSGKASEANPKVIRGRRREALKKRGEREGKTYSPDETRI